LARAGQQNPSALKKAVNRAVLRADPQAAEKRAEQRRAGRRVELSVSGDGVADLTGRDLPAETSVAIYRHVDACARQLHDPGDGWSMDQRRADTYVSLLLGTHAGCGHDGLAALNITVSAQELIGKSEEPGFLAGYGELPAGICRQLAVDGRWRRLLVDQP